MRVFWPLTLLSLFDVWKHLFIKMGWGWRVEWRNLIFPQPLNKHTFGKRELQAFWRSIFFQYSLIINKTCKQLACTGNYSRQPYLSPNSPPPKRVNLLPHGQWILQFKTGHYKRNSNSAISLFPMTVIVQKKLLIHVHYVTTLDLP